MGAKLGKKFRVKESRPEAAVCYEEEFLKQFVSLFYRLFHASSEPSLRP